MEWQKIGVSAIPWEQKSMNWYIKKASPDGEEDNSHPQSAPGYPYYIAIHREGRLKGQAPESIRMVPNLKREWDRGGFGTGHKMQEFKGKSIREVFNKLRDHGINPSYDEVDFYEVRAPNSPRRGLNRQRVFSILSRASSQGINLTAGYDDDEAENLIETAFEEVMVPEHNITNTSTCETIYEIMGERIRLGIIVGGTPALWFEDYSFCERFPQVQSWGDDAWDKASGKYKHQDTFNIKGPTYDVLPNGKWTLIDYAQRNIPLKRSREERLAGLPINGRLISKGFQDPVSGVRVRLKTRLDGHGFYKVEVESRKFDGDASQVLSRAPAWWRKYYNFINPIWSRTATQSYLNVQFENLTDEEYQQMVTLLKEGLTSGAIIVASR